MTNICLCLKQALPINMIAQLECLSEETDSQTKVAFGLEYKTNQMASPTNNVLSKHKIREKQYQQPASSRVSCPHCGVHSHRQRHPSTFQRRMTGESGTQKWHV